MMLNCMNRRLHFSLIKPAQINKSFFHATKSTCDDDQQTKSPTEAEQKLSEAEAKSKQEKRQLQKAKMAKFGGFITLENKTKTDTFSKTVLHNVRQPFIKIQPDSDKLQATVTASSSQDEERIEKLVEKSMKTPMPPIDKVFKKPAKRPSSVVESLNELPKKSESGQPMTFDTALKVARLIDNVNPEQTASMLLEPMNKMREKKELLKKQEKEQKSQQPPPNELKSLLNNLKNLDPKIEVDKESKESKRSPLTDKDFEMDRKELKNYRGSPYQIFQNLKSGNGLAIFSKSKSKGSVVTEESPIWLMHNEDVLKSAQDFPPLNGFDEIIKLTDEGKLWRFPIDNQQDLAEKEEDARVPFHEHIFLEGHLDEFPQIEPIQQFMTLAINGLSQNGYISLSEKKEIINWYKEYFENNLELIKEALEAEVQEKQFRESLVSAAAAATASPSSSTSPTS